MLTGRVAVVTGAGKGIGRVTAYELARAGAKVVLVGNRPDSINEFSGYLSELGLSSIAIEADVADFHAVRNMAGRVKDTYGRIDILVNNAGIPCTKTASAASWHIPTLEIDDDEWDAVLAVNLKGQFNCVKAALPYMMAQKGGSIINVSSSAAFAPSTGSVHYCASKAGIVGLTRALALEFASYGIRVNCVAPGLTLTPAHNSIPEEEIRVAGSAIPLGRAGLPSDIARTVLFFASNGLFVTGQTLLVNGGGAMH